MFVVDAGDVVRWLNAVARNKFSFNTQKWGFFKPGGPVFPQVNNSEITQKKKKMEVSAVFFPSE